MQPIASPRREGRTTYVLTGLLAATAVLATGCQDALRIGGENLCRRSIEVRVTDTEGDWSVPWVEINPGGRRYISDGSARTSTFYVQVRRDEDDLATHVFNVSAADMPPPPDGVSYEAEIVIAGDRCPSGG